MKLWITGTARTFSAAAEKRWGRAAPADAQSYVPRRTAPGACLCSARAWGLHRGAHCPCSVRANLGGHRLRAASAALILSGAARGGLVARRRVWGRTPLRPHPRHRPEAVAAQALPRLRCALPKLRIGAGAMSTPLHRLGCGPVRNGRAADLWSVGRGHDDNRRDSASLTRIAAADQRRVARDFGGTRARPELPVGPCGPAAHCPSRQAYPEPSRKDKGGEVVGVHVDLHRC